MASRGLLFIAVLSLLIAVVSLVEHRLYCTHTSVAGAPRLWSERSPVVALGLSCSKACGIFPHQGWNQHPSTGRQSLSTVPPGRSPNSIFTVILLDDVCVSVSLVIFDNSAQVLS